MKSVPQLLALSKELHDVIQHNLLAVQGTPGPQTILPGSPITSGEPMRNPYEGGFFNTVHEMNEVVIQTRGKVYDTERTLRPAPTGQCEMAREMGPYQALPLLVAIAENLRDIHVSLTYQKELLFGKGDTPTVGEEMLVGYSKFTEESVETLGDYCFEALTKCLVIAKCIKGFLGEAMRDSTRDPVCTQTLADTD